MATNVTAPTLIRSIDGVYQYSDTIAFNSQNDCERINWTVPSEGRSGRWRLLAIYVLCQSATTAFDVSAAAYGVRFSITPPSAAAYQIGVARPLAIYNDGDTAIDGWAAELHFPSWQVIQSGDQLDIFTVPADTAGVPTGDYFVYVSLLPI